MISLETLKKLSQQYQVGLFPNVIREYVQHLFLSELYKLPTSERCLFKGGTALRIIYGSPRFSEDLDFSLVNVVKIKPFVEGLFIKVLEKISNQGITVEIGERIGRTSGGYFGLATFQLFTFQPITIEINISSRTKKNLPYEIDSIVGEFVPTYSIIHLAQTEIVEEKIFGALLIRKKPRDFYDFYFLMRKGMLTVEQKKRLAHYQLEVLRAAKKINWRRELGPFLPEHQQPMLRNFDQVLVAEMKRQIA